MKNYINYYYNLLISEIRKSDIYYTFFIDNVEYSFVPFNGNFDKLYENYIITIQNRRYVHEIIFNKFKNIISIYNDMPYILIKKNIIINDKISHEYIMSYDFPVYKKIRIEWKDLWKNKINYYEYQIKEIGYKYTTIKESFSYYIGISECAISLLNYVDYNEVKPYMQHKRINYKERITDFCDPLNLIIDSKVRDISEYLKLNYLYEEISLNDSIDIINSIDLNRSEAIMLLCRLLYPSYYFDMYDLIIQEKIKSEKINFYIKKNVYYETFLKHIYSLLKIKYKIPIIEWLEN